MRINQRIHQQNNKKFFAKRTNVDIPVYKVIRKYWAGEYHGWLYETPVMFTKIEINKTLLVTSFEQFTHSDIVIHGYHSFSSLREANKFIKFMNIRGLIVFESIIPRGSLYYVGMQGYMLSNSLKLIREI